MEKTFYQKLIDDVNYCIIKRVMPTIDLLYQLAIFITYRTYKKLYSVSCNDTIRELYNSLFRDSSIVSNCIFNDTISNSFDNVQETLTKIIEMIRYCIDNSKDYTRVYFDSEITVYRQGKTIIFDSISKDFKTLLEKGIIKEVTTTPIKECYRACSRYISKQGSPNVKTTKTIKTAGGQKKVVAGIIEHKYFSELENVDCDGNTQLEIELYRRAPKYDGLTDSISDLEKIDLIIEKMELSPRELEILSLRRTGNGLDKIAKMLNVSKSTVQTNMKRIQQKAAKIGLTPLMNSLTDVLKEFYNIV